MSIESERQDARKTITVKSRVADMFLERPVCHENRLRYVSGWFCTEPACEHQELAWPTG
jgi:hypothetical protein